MFTTLFSLSLLVALIRSVLAQSDGTFTVYTPSLTQCQPANINWTDTGNSPYEVFIVPAENPCDSEALMYLGNQTSTSLTCTPDITAGTQVDVLVLDSTGDEAWSATITVGSSNDASCLASNPSPHPPTTTSGSSSFSGTPTHASSTPSITFSPAGAAGAGLVGSSGALSTRPLSSVTLLGSAVLAAVAFAL